MIARSESGNGSGKPPSRGHKRCKLTPSQEEKVAKTLDNDPLKTNQELAAVVGNKIAPRTVSDVLARASPRFSTKRFYDQEPEELTPQ